MLGSKARGQCELLMAGSLRDLVPDDHVLARVDRVLDLSWLRAEVRNCYAADGAGRPPHPGGEQRQKKGGPKKKVPPDPPGGEGANNPPNPPAEPRLQAAHRR